MKPGKLILVVLLFLNLLMQVFGGAVFVTSPDRAAEMFAVTANPESAQLLGVIGATTLAFGVMSVVAFVSVLRDRLAGYTLAVVEAAMLVVTGAGMLYTGTAMGTVDLAKGVVIGAVAWWARPQVT